MNMLRIPAPLALAAGLAQPLSAQCPEVDRIVPGSPTFQFGESQAREGDLLVVGAAGGGTIGSGEIFLYRLDAATNQWVQEAQLEPSDGVQFDLFGSSVATDGDRVVVGSPNADGPNGTDQGAAYVFAYDLALGMWSEEAKLTSGAAEARDLFGTSVAISEDVVVVGSPITGLGGSAFVFRDHQTLNWIEEEELVAPDQTNNAQAGTSVLMLGSDRVLVGVPSGDSPEGRGHGSVDVWDYDGATWQHTQDVYGTGLHANARFGESLAQSEGRLVVGAPHLTVGGFHTAGAVHTFVTSDGVYVEEAQLVAESPQTIARLGTSVSVLGDLIVAGAPGVNDGGTGSAGAAYLWRAWKGRWHQDIPMMARVPQLHGGLGTSVLLDDDFVLAGTPAADNHMGAIYRFSTDEFRLEVSDLQPSPGDPLTVQALCGEPGAPVLLVVAELDGAPLFIPLIFFVFGADYTFTLNGNAPDPAFGVNLGLQALKLGPRGPISLTDVARIDV